MEELGPHRFQWVLVLQAFPVGPHRALPQCRFACCTRSETTRQADIRPAETMVWTREPHLFEWISLLQALGAGAHHALEQRLFSLHTSDEWPQYFQRSSGALLGQVVLPRGSPSIGDTGTRKQ